MLRYPSCLMFGIALICVSCSDSPSKKNHKAPIPDPGDISEMTASIYQSSLGLTPIEDFRVPKEYFTEIIDKLLSTEEDPDPAKWEGFGTVEILDSQASKTMIRLYMTGRPPDTEFEFRFEGHPGYWRGGRAADLEKIIRDAKAASMP